MNPPHGNPTIAELLEQAPWLRRLAAKLVAGDAADDLVQETWLAALTHPPLRGGPMRPWLARVARNLAKNLRRGERRRSGHERHGAPPLPELDPRRIAEEIEAQRVLAEAVLRLEEPLRTTVVLRYFRGHDSSEIARLQGVPAGTVRWRLQRGLELLRDDLDRRFQGGRSWRALFATLAPYEGAASALALGATLMSASTKTGIVAAVAAASLLTVWMLVDAPGETGGGLGAPLADRAVGSGPGRTLSEDRERGVPVAASRAQRVALPEEPMPADPVPAECCIVGRVVDAEGRGLTGARVLARAATLGQNTLHGQFAQRPGPVTTVAGPGGSFSLPVPELRPFVLSATHPDFAPGASTLAFAGERRDILLHPGSELAVRVVARSPSTGAPESATPCAGAVVRAHVALPDSRATLWDGEGRTDAAGEVTFRGVPAGDVAVAAGLAKRRASHRVTTDGRARAACELELRATGRVEGMVLDRASRLPVAGARVGIRFHAETTTDRAGRYGLDEITLGAGIFTVTARARGYAARHERVVVDAGSERQVVNFGLERAVRVLGTVIDRSGRPIAGARVAWTGTIDTGAFVGETERSEAETDTRGGFEMGDLHPATAYRMLVFAEGYGTGVFTCGPIESGASHAGSVELGVFTLDPAGSIAGVVPEARAGEPHCVQLHWEEEDPVARMPKPSHLETARTDARGRFAFHGFAAGRYRLALWRTAEPSWSEPPLAEEIVLLGAGEERRNVVLGTGGGTITGRVVEEAGAPLARCHVRIFALSAPARELAAAHTGEDGRFRLHVHDQGPFRVLAEDPSLLFDSRAVEPVAVHDDLRVVLPVFRSEHVIGGRVVTVDGEVPANVYVAFTDTVAKERLARVAIPDVDGRFEMKNLRPVPYDVESVDFSGGYGIARVAGVLPGAAGVELRLKKRP